MSRLSSFSWTNSRRNGEISGSTGSLDANGEFSLFSGSFPSLLNNKLTDTEAYSADTRNGEVFGGGVFGSMEEVDSELETLGNLLPDEEELLAGIGEEFDRLLPAAEENEDFDLFSSGGGLELEGEAELCESGSAQHRATVGEHPSGEHPSRTLFVRNINSNVEDGELRALFEQYGDIRTLYTACKHRGFVMISFYDIRSARSAMRALQGKPLRRRKLDIHFSIPKDNPSDKDVNQGTLVVFNLDSSVSNDELRKIFGYYGEIKEIRETPHKRHHKFVEFYDVRSAEAALRALNRSDIAGKRIKLEPSRPGGARKAQLQQPRQEVDQEDSYADKLSWNLSPPAAEWGIMNDAFERNFSSRLNLQEVLHQNKIIDQQVIGHPHSLPDFNNNFLHNIHGPFSSGALGSSPFEHNNNGFEGRNLNRTSSSVTYGHINRVPAVAGISSLPSLSSHSQPVLWSGGSAYSQSNNKLSGHPCSLPSHSIDHLTQQFASFRRELPSDHYLAGESALHIKPNSCGSMRQIATSAAVGGDHHYQHQQHAPSSPNFGMFLPQRILSSSPMDERRSRQNGSEIKKHFQLDLDRIISGEDVRTTLMIKNIPNKYTSKMLLAAIDEHHRGTYDFIYLPIDFKNKCNVGYAFINMLSPSLIVSFYQTFNGKKWEKFNSEKVASLAYARIQGKSALIAHFQNSSLMNEDKRCRPIIFQLDGANAASVNEFQVLAHTHFCR